MTSEELKGIGKRISERRKQLGLTQERIAEVMDVSIQMISNLERGNKAIKIDNLIKISEILGVSTDYILTGKHSHNDIREIAGKLSLLNESDFKMINIIIDHCLNR